MVNHAIVKFSLFALSLLLWGITALFSIVYADQPSQEFVELQQRAESGDRAAQFSLGTAYDSGHEVKADLLKAAVWYEKAAKQGHVDAQFNLAVLYDDGVGVRQDHRQALYWYGQAADQGMAEAGNNLGLLYVRGQGVEQDYDKAFEQFQKSAKTGFSDAVFNLGLMHREGFGTAKDLLKAFALFASVHEHHDGAAAAYQELSEQLSQQEQLTALGQKP